MKAIIWIIVLLLIGWGIWHWVVKPSNTNNTADVSGAVSDYGNATSSSDTSGGAGSGTSTNEYNSKG